MLYEIFFSLREWFFGFNLFKYVTFRSLGALITGFLITVLLMPIFINWVKLLGVIQQERIFGVESHLKKQGTPTMGGIVFILSGVISALLWGRLNNVFLWIEIGVIISFGFIGFLDDFLKKVNVSHKGLSMFHKYSLQVFFAIVWIVAIKNIKAFAQYFNMLYVPYTNELFLVLPTFVMFLFYLLVITGSSNAVNLSDGVDGLAGGLSVIALSVFLILSYLSGNIVISTYLRIPFVEGVGELSVFIASLIGGIGGFLWYNAHPASIFMGDVGSVSIGAIFGTMSIFVKQEILLVVIGMVFVLETLSVALQIVYFKITGGKRIFKMSPLHHHFELSGWSETQVVIRFWILGIMFAVIALASLKIR